MRILITGGTGFIGAPLIESLLASGNELIVLSRQVRSDRPRCHFIQNLDTIRADEKIDAIINLAGASLAARRWSESYKEEIVRSRMSIVSALLDLMMRLMQPPQVFLSASAVGYYGHNGDEPLTEASSTTPGFAQKLCSDWEALALTAQSLGVRVCLLRFGVVLDSGGGALVEMARSFHFGVASWLGNGHQWISWVHRQDVIRGVTWLLERDDLQGPFNITAPEPITGRRLCKSLQAHHRTFISVGVPAPVVRLLVGGMADELLLRGQRVLPAQLQTAGFDFTYPDIGSALVAIYGPSAS